MSNYLESADENTEQIEGVVSTRGKRTKKGELAKTAPQELAQVDSNQAVELVVEVMVNQSHSQKIALMAEIMSKSQFDSGMMQQLAKAVAAKNVKNFNQMVTNAEREIIARMKPITMDDVLQGKTVQEFVDELYDR